MYCYIYAGLCSRWHPLWGVKWDNRCVWGATYDSPQLFSRTLSQVTPSSYCLRWLPTVVTARFDFGPGSTWFWTRVHLILDPGQFDYDYDYDYAFPSAIGQGWPSLSCKFSMQIRPGSNYLWGFTSGSPQCLRWLPTEGGCLLHCLPGRVLCFK